jgi:hypothetical protein
MLNNGAVTVTLTINSVGTRYVMVLFRTFSEPNSPEDIKKAHALQDAIQIRQAAPGKLELVAKIDGVPHGFGPGGGVVPIQHLVAADTAAGL